jgi:hypothetical protein
VRDAYLVDTLHVAVAPVELGRGGKLWDSPDELLDRFHLEQVPSPSASHTISSGAADTTDLPRRPSLCSLLVKRVEWIRPTGQA